MQKCALLSREEQGSVLNTIVDVEQTVTDEE